MVATFDTDALRRSALEHLWMHNADWVQMAEEGGPLVIVEGSGIRVTDSTGKTWIDARGGYASVNVGYGRTEIAEAARQQMRRLSYFPQGTTTEPLVRLAEKLAQITPGDLERVWPVSGGSEANETAIKIARAYHRRRGEPGRYKVVSRRGSYHGATGGVLWLGGDGDAGRSDYGPPYPGMLYAPQPYPYRCQLGGQTPSECAVRCAQAVEDLIVAEDPRTVAAVIAEPIAGGMVPGDEYWPMLRETCNRHAVVLIADEVITGFGRTGKMFGMEHWGVMPDIMTVAKGLTSSYVPMGAAIVASHVADAFAGEANTFLQALTFGGHPVAAAAALKNIEIIEAEGLVQNAATVGGHLRRRLVDLAEQHPIVGEVRGLGLHLAVELVKDRRTKQPFPKEAMVGERLDESFRRQALILKSRGDTVLLAPPLCATLGEVDEIADRLERALAEVERALNVTD